MTEEQYLGQYSTVRQKGPVLISFYALFVLKARGRQLPVSDARAIFTC